MYWIFSKKILLAPTFVHYAQLVSSYGKDTPQEAGGKGGKSSEIKIPSQPHQPMVESEQKSSTWVKVTVSIGTRAMCCESFYCIS